MKSILDKEKAWVDDEYAWLNASYTGPLPADPWMIAEAAGSFRPTKYPTVEQVLDDLCRILEIERTLVTHEYLDDLPDRQPAPSSLTVQHGPDGLQVFVLGLAESTRTHVVQVLKKCILWMVDVRLRLSNVMLPEDGEARMQWAELAAIFFGFGPIMAQRRFETVRMAVGRWTETITYHSYLPSAVFAYALLVHQKHHGIDSAMLLKPLPSEVRYDVKQAIADRSSAP